MKVFLVLISILLFCVNTVHLKKWKDKPDWAKKDIRDFDEADMERLLDQWEEDEEPLPDDELPEYKRKPPAQPSIDLNNIGSYKPDELMKLSKKGKTVMMFVNIDGNPSRDECETLTNIWQGSLRNDHIQAERYVIDDARAIFLFNDGSQAWEAKDYLIEQERVKEVTLEGQTYDGKKTTEKSSNSKPNKSINPKSEL